MTNEMMEVIELDDGRFVVRAIGGGDLDDTLAIFDTEDEANEWMLTEALRREDEPGIMTPGGGQGIH